MITEICIVGRRVISIIPLQMTIGPSFYNYINISNYMGPIPYFYNRVFGWAFEKYILNEIDFG